MIREQPIPTIDWLTLAPMTTVVVAGLVALFIEMFRPKQSNGPIVTVSVVGLALAGALTLAQFGMEPGPTFAGMMVRDQVGLVLQLLLIGVCLLTFLFSDPYLREKKIAFAEFYQLALWSTAGGMIMVSTTNMLMLFLGLEVLSIALYCMAGMDRKQAKSQESAIKYFLLGAFASAFLLMGIAYIYGPTGSLDLGGIAMIAAMPESGYLTMAVFGVGMLLVGLMFKAALVPFHQWAPDVYQGAPTNVTAFMAAASKVAAIGALARVLSASGALQEFWLPALFWVAIATMVVGNFAALVQKDVKRTLGYSSIANAGYVLVALLAHVKKPDQVPLTTALFFLVVYCLMTVGSFAVVSLAAKGGEEGTRFQDLHGLWKRAPFAVGCLIVFVASLIGIPPTAGFFAKLFIFQDALSTGLVPLAIVLAVTSAVSVYYYLGIIQATFVSDEGARKTVSANPSFGLNLVCLFCALAVLVVSLAAAPVSQWLRGSTQLPGEAQARSELQLDSGGRVGAR
ncbi:MAG: NADH-quinone oxidoreductase subunit N [Fimbriimonadaceae bacterium]|nr:NADH-quinone oxidoreductase subunit N [Fimbriimonadaceae bacterium]QYK57744.1 MAG: NADH-quinone oxidoreductase subunit N [Fimbriimonadaceae bacterium]